MHFFRPTVRPVLKGRQARKALRVRRVQLVQPANKVPQVLREASAQRVHKGRLVPPALQAHKDLQAPQVRKVQPAHRAPPERRDHKERA